jgi:hypothetical protein
MYQSFASDRTDHGIQIDFNARQEQNVPYSIRVSFESDSNSNDERDKQDEKHFSPRTLTYDATQIDFNALQPQNAFPSIRASCESDLNVNE